MKLTLQPAPACPPARGSNINATSRTQVRVGVPHTGGQLIEAARQRGYPVLLSANAFATTFPKGHPREGEFRRFRLPKAGLFDGLDVSLDSAGFVAAARYGDYRWNVSQYYDLVEAGRWTWNAAMDMACEPEIAADRPMRLLRLAATAFLYGRCSAEARRRGLPPPMPILQGWTPDEYITSVDWLPVQEWPALVGVGSVCRRQVHGPDGILAIVQAIDAVLPPHCRLHLFGVKSTALAHLACHPRIAAVDSMAWDFGARAERRTGRDMAFRIEKMEAWAERQLAIAADVEPGAGLQTYLFNPCDFGGSISSVEARVLEALSLLYAELVMSGDIEYREAVIHSKRDAASVIAILRRGGARSEVVADLEDVFSDLGNRCEDLIS